ncbi:MAG TPA: dephospho-CoA kinase [Bacteroidales bacterium]|nr:dephospho-CoA kinase [Bacteroidales bacterium]
MTAKLGVTGGIGSGKTTVCRVFTVLGIPVFLADDAAKELMNNNLILREKINSVAGKDLYTKGYLDRKELAQLIFSNHSLLEKVNSLVHPMVFESFENWVTELDTPYLIMEAAILFESQAYKLVDRVVSITAPIEERISRVMGRSELTRNQVLERVSSQMDDEERNERSYYVINNSDSELIIPEILKIHEDMLRFAARMK